MAALVFIFLPTLTMAQIGEITIDASSPNEAKLAPHDPSAVWIHSGSRIYLMLRDAQGHRTGVDAKTRKLRQDIPNSDCQADFIENQYTGDPVSELNERLTLQPAAKGIYTLDITGLQDGPFEINILAQSRNGSSLPSKQLEGLINEGQQKTFSLKFDPDAGSPLSIVEESSKPH